MAQQGFVRVASTSEIPLGTMRKVEAAGEEILIVNIDDKYYALNNICTHVGGPLDEGRLQGYEVWCPWHASHFDVRTGEVKGGPARLPEKTYQVKVEGSNILVKPR
jgi:3-phenylpropionate/trans-cinnamate dioxygenase ferredoxin subunit